MKFTCRKQGGFRVPAAGRQLRREPSSFGLRASFVIRVSSFGIATLALMLWLAPAAAGPLDPAIDSAMERDPVIALPEPIVRYSPRHKSLWLEALAQPEADLKRLAADSIARGQRRGIPGLSETIPALLREMQAPDQHHVVRLAVARALVELDARQAADALRRHAADDLDVALSVEPALARWNDQPARAMWLDRLDDPEVRHRQLLLAIAGLGVVGEERAAEPLLGLAVSSSRAVDVRLTAAEALARLRDSGLEDTARQLAADKSRPALVDRLVAARLLGTHTGAEAEALLAELAVDPEPAVARMALARLLEIDPGLVVPLALEATQRDDPHVRSLGAEALVARPSAAHVESLGRLLEDVHPDVRRYVRRSLIELAKDPSLAQPVIEAALEAIEGDGWRAQEQALFVLVALEHRPVIPRAVELLESGRPEVLVTAAWGLRRLDARDVLEAMLDRATRATDLVLGDSGPVGDRDAIARQVGHLCEMFGIAKYRPAEPLLRRYIPKTEAISSVTRAQAIWALGHLHAGQDEPSLSKLLAQRLADVGPIMPEFFEVRTASAITLGRMQARNELPVLRRFAAADPLGYACYWAIRELTGEPIPEFPTPVQQPRGWFLTPID